MSGNLECLKLQQEDVTKLLVCAVHTGTKNLDYQMEQYCYKMKTDGTFLINVAKTWEKLLLAARAVAAIEHPADVCAISSRLFGQRSVLKYARYTGSSSIAGRFTPGTFTNQIQEAFKEPRLLIVTDPRADHQPVREASYVNIPVIAFCNTDAPLKYVDIAIPCNTGSPKAVGLMWWLLAREVLRLRGTLSRDRPWEVMCDLFFYRDAEEQEKDEQAALQDKQPAVPGAAPPQEMDQDWGAEPVATGGGPVTDWANEMGASLSTTQFAAKPAEPAQPEQWSAQQPGQQQDNWGAGGSNNW